MKMSMEEQMKKMSKAQQEKKQKEQDEIMRKKQEILAQVLGKKPPTVSQQPQQQPIQNQIIQEQYDQEDSSRMLNNSKQSHHNNDMSSQLDSQRSSDKVVQIEESCSLNDRDSEYNEDDYVKHDPDKFGVTSHFGAGKPSYQQLQQQNFMHQPPQSLSQNEQMRQSKIAYHNNFEGSPQTQQTITDNESDLYKYSSEDNSSRATVTPQSINKNNQSQDLRYQSIGQVQKSHQYLPHQQQNDNSSNKHSRIQSASSKNRQEHYDKYQMNMSINSEEYDKLYQHGRTKELQEMGINNINSSAAAFRLSQTQNNNRSSINPHNKMPPQFDDISYGDDHLRSGQSIHQDSAASIQQESNLSQNNKTQNSKLITFGKDQGNNNDPIDYSQSLVHIETSMGGGGKYKQNSKYQDDDLPEELREYERQLLAQLDEQLDEEDQYYQEEDEEDNHHLNQEVKQSKQQLDTLDSKFRVSLAADSRVKQSAQNYKNQNKNQGDEFDDEEVSNDPLREYYDLQKRIEQSKQQDQQEDDFYNEFDQDNTNQNDDDDNGGDYNDEEFDNQDNNNDNQQQQDIDDGDDTEQPSSQLQQQKQKGIALDFGIDEGTIKERKLKKFEELKQRKLQEMEERKQQQRDKSGDRTSASQANKRLQQQQQQKFNNKSPLREKSPINSTKIQQQKQRHSPYKNNQRDKSPVDAKMHGGKQIMRRPAPYNQLEEEKNSIQVSQSKFDYLQNKNVPLAANVPQHLLKKQQQKLQDESQLSSHHPTPKQTSSQNPNSKKNFVKNSNKKLIKNAINVILGGETNKAQREEVLKVIDESDHPYYIIMFRGNLGRQDYKALFSHDGTGQVEKIHGPSTGNVPEVLHDHMIEKFFRYDSGNKVFKELPGIKGFTLTTDAVALQKKYNQKTNNINNLY